MVAGIPGRGVKGDASLFSFPATLGYFMLRKTCLLSSGILPVYIAFGDEGYVDIWAKAATPGSAAHSLLPPIVSKNCTKRFTIITSF